MSLTLVAPSTARPFEMALAQPMTDARAPFSAERNPYLFPTSLLEDASVHSPNPPPSEASEDSDAQAAWWLVHTKPRQEKKLAHDLRSLKIEHFLPVVPHRALTRGRMRVTWAPLFPGYLFQYGSLESRIQVLTTNRVVAIHPVADRLRMKCQLRDLADLIEKNVPLRVEERFPIGRTVRVKAGALTDKCGIVVKHGGKTRLFIRVNELLGGVSVELDHQLVEPY